MNDQDLNNFFKPAKELIKRLPKTHSSTTKNNTSELLIKQTMIHPFVYKNANKDQKKKLNKSIEDVSKHYEKTVKTQNQGIFDREYLVNENERLKKVINKKNLIIDELRFSNLKMDERNEKNLKNFEEIIEKTKKFALTQSSSNFYKRSTISEKKPNQGNADIRATYNQTSPNRLETDPLGKSINFDEIENSKELEMEPNTALKPDHLEYGIKRIKEISLVNGLRRQILDFKSQLKKKDEEIERIKASIKFIKYTELDNNYKKQSDEQELLRQELEIVTKALNEKDQRLRNIGEEQHTMKSQLNLYKIRYDDGTETISRLQQENKDLKAKIKELEEKAKNLEYRVHFVKHTVKEKEKEIEKQKLEHESYENFKNERASLDFKVQDLNGKCSAYKMDIKTKSNKILELEKKITLMQEDLAKSQNNISKKLKQHEATLSGYKEEKENFNKKMEELKQKHEKALEEVNNELKQVKESLEASESKSNTLSDSLTEQEKENTALKKELQNLNEKAKSFNAERTGLKQELEELRAKLEGFEAKEQEKLESEQANNKSEKEKSK